MSSYQEPAEMGFMQDFSFLATSLPSLKKESKFSFANDKDAETIMNIWMKADRKAENKFSVTDKTGVNSRDIYRLKTNGFISGGPSEVSFTDRGKTVIAVMALGETSEFSKKKVQKTYTEILASMDKRGKAGYRIPKYATNVSNSLRLNYGKDQ